MKNFNLCLLIIIFLELIFSCNDKKEDVSIINIKNFSSPNIIITDSYDNLVSKMGIPDRSFLLPFRNYKNDGSYILDSCYMLYYEQKGLTYVQQNNFVHLRFVNYTKENALVLNYKKYVLDRNFTMEDARNYLFVADSCFFYVDSEDLMCGLDMTGYILNMCSDETMFEFYEFYFGADSCLKGLYFPIQTIKNITK